MSGLCDVGPGASGPDASSRGLWGRGAGAWEAAFSAGSGAAPTARLGTTVWEPLVPATAWGTGRAFNGPRL